MVKTDAIAGIVNDEFRFHYDIFADVLYIRLLSAEGLTTYGDLTDEGDILLRDEQTHRAVGLTVVSWWKRYGAGILPDSIREIQKRIEPLTGKMAA
ncbi:MAG: hypothetical protein WC058_03195 [Phycisphaeraceae bacterium]